MSGWKHECADPGAPWFATASLTGSTTGNTTNANDGYGGCSTAYSWSSGGNNHLCNDDAAYEMWQAGNGNQGAGTTGWIGTYNGFCEGSLCKSGSPAHYACTESNNGGSVGSWNTPNCF
jgi:hypothetical protein